jgi:adenosine deaminase
MLEHPALPDLHRHLDGSLRQSTLEDLARQHGVALPADIRFFPRMGLRAALERFAITLSVLQAPAAVRRIASEIAEDAIHEGVTTLEVRFAPQLHKGAPVEAIVDAALEGFAGRAGLLLCGLYGESPDILLKLVDIARTRTHVVGIDLAGGPAPDHGWHMEDYVTAFSKAKDWGIGRTVHASEGRPPHETRMAIEVLHVQRVGHATTLLDDNLVLDLVLKHQVTLEACPTSNVHTGAIDSVLRHPLPLWLQRGVQACICTDNTLFSDVTAQGEHANSRSIPGMTDALLAKAIQFGHRAAFRRQ